MIYKQIINKRIKPFYIKCDIYNINNNLNLQKLLITENDYKIINTNNINNYIKYLINKWLIFIQDIDSSFIKEHNITNIIDIFKQINNYIPLYKIIDIINLQIFDDNETIILNKKYIEYKYKYCNKFNFRINFPKNNIQLNQQLLLNKINLQKLDKIKNINKYNIDNSLYYKINQLINKFILDYNDIHYNCNMIKYKQYYIIRYYLIFLIIIIFSILIFIFK